MLHLKIHMRTAEINLEKYRHFWISLREKLSPNTRILAVVKSNAYGLGALPLSQFLQTHNLVDYLGIATPQEGQALREQGITLPLLLFSEPPTNEIPLIIKYDLDQISCSSLFIQSLAKEAQIQNKLINIHLKIDTGMGRIGCLPNEAAQLTQFIQNHPYLKLKGICTHFASADEPNSPKTLQQLNLFKKTLAPLTLSNETIKHCANSAATAYYPESHMDMVRIGIDSYKNIVSLKTRVQSIKHLTAGSEISYGGTYILPKDTRIAVIEWGYADGLPREYRGVVLIKGKRYPIIGRICMDLLMIDIEEDDILPEDSVTILGENHAQKIPLEIFSQNALRTPYESLLAIGSRVSRHYNPI